VLAFFHKFINDHSMNAVDAGAGGITLAAFFQFIPTVSAFLSAVWLGLRIYVLIRDEVIGKKRSTDGD
jgi:hypothetical protein